MWGRLIPQKPSPSSVFAEIDKARAEKARRERARRARAA